MTGPSKRATFDGTVNVVPLAVVAFFVLPLLAVDWGNEPFARAVSLVVLALPLALLTLLTYVASIVIRHDGVEG